MHALYLPNCIYPSVAGLIVAGLQTCGSPSSSGSSSSTAKDSGTVGASATVFILAAGHRTISAQ